MRLDAWDSVKQAWRLDFMDDLRVLLREKFGHQSLRSGQAEVIRPLMAGRPVLAVFPTGGGKSLCYQLPALLRPGVGLVVSPLIALMLEHALAY